MKRKTMLTLSAAATIAIIGTIAAPAIAESWGPAQMMQRMHGSEGGFMQGNRGAGPMMMQDEHGPMGMGDLADNPVYTSFDSDGNGTVTTAELEAGLAALHAEHDADDNGALSSDEFSALFADVTGSMAGRPFAMLDADGDGQISAEEMAFPAQMMARMPAWHGSAPDAGTEQQ